MIKSKYRKLMLLIVFFTVLIMIINHYYLKIDLCLVIQGKSALNSEKLTKLELNEISKIIIITRRNIKKSIVVEQIKKNGYTYVEQVGAVRVFEKNNVKYILSKKIVYKYFIQWKFKKSYEVK